MQKTEKLNDSDVAIRDLPTIERPREKLFRYGAAALSNSELLAILIGSGTRRQSALTLANRVLTLGSGGLGDLADLSPEELIKLPGLGPAKACQVLAAVELGRRMAVTPRQDRPEIADPNDVAGLFMEKMRYLKKEHFTVLFLSTKNEIICAEEISVGNLNSSIVHPREVFRGAVKRGAAAVILVHNHPSGHPQPSQNDIDVTRRLVEAGDLMGIPVLDHLIIGDGVFISLKEQNLM
ncbi:MAG TPA: DNA repair protein RadC [Clostridiales bacterium]|jgi:DNA repair protein RadC|nr:DNA repair protein RadC [Clostridiales bacterium]